MSSGTELAIIEQSPAANELATTDRDDHMPIEGVGPIEVVDHPAASMGQMMQIAQACALSGFYKDVRNASQALVKMLAGREMNIGPIMALSVIHIIEGRPTASATVLAAKVKASKRYDFRPVRRDNEACILEWLDRGKVVGRSEWTMEDARRAGLANKTNWKHHPRAMLFANALKEGMRVYCPEICCGVYSTEELAPDLEIGASGEVTAEAWERFTAGQKTLDQEKKEKAPVKSAMELIKEQAEAAARIAAGGSTTPSLTPAQQRVSSPAPANDNGFPATDTQVAIAKSYFTSLGASKDQVVACLGAVGAKSFAELTAAQCDAIVARLCGKVVAKGLVSINACKAALAKANLPTSQIDVAAHDAQRPGGEGKATRGQLRDLKRLCDALAWSQPAQLGWLTQQKVIGGFQGCTEQQMAELIAKLEGLAMKNAAGKAGTSSPN